MTIPVHLVSITPNAEELIAYCARVSNPTNQDNPSIAGLLGYCIKHKHWSVFEMANMVLEINTTRSIADQLLRHRSFSFQQFSTRYAPVTDKACVPALRRQDLKNRQASVDDLPHAITGHHAARMGQLFDMSYRLYQDMLADGVARECAREVLPLATPTRLYMNGSIRSWLHYVDLRSGNGTQPEHRAIASGVQDVLVANLPNVAMAMWADK